MITVLDRPLNHMLVLQAGRHADERGYFSEIYKESDFKKIGILAKFVQDNESVSNKGVVRGLHFQYEPKMGKLMRVVNGAAYLVAVNLRFGDPYYGKSWGMLLKPSDNIWVWAPHYFARGFMALEDNTRIHYKCTGEYGSGEGAISWSDPKLEIDWPHMAIDKYRGIKLTVSDKDLVAPKLADWENTEQAKALFSSIDGCNMDVLNEK